jgi:hypothetical protein
VQNEGLLSNDLTGSLLRFRPGSAEPEVVVGEGLVSPTSVAVADDGAIYVSSFGCFPGQGRSSALRRRPDHPTPPPKRS